MNPLQDKQRGCLIGLAIGDALGAAVEFQMPGSFEPVTDFRAGGPHGLNRGEWTDDTSMALALADSIAKVGWDLDDQAQRYVFLVEAWRILSKWPLLRDIGRDAVEQWLVARKADGMAARTRNSYLQAIRGFCNWCVQTNRMVTNPLSKITKADEKSDRRRQRRALSEDELSRLLFIARLRPLAEYGRKTVKKPRNPEKTRAGWTKEPLTFETVDAATVRARDRLRNNPSLVAAQELLGRERALIYKTLILTGLRKGELASITLAQVHLDEATPCIELDAADEKNREGCELPLRSDLVADLRQWIADKRERLRSDATIAMDCQQSQDRMAATPLFTVPVKLIKILNRDLVAAGIPKRDERGRTIDVHALRHSFGTLLSRGGVPPRTAQAAMRHSSIDLTMNVYTDPKLLDIQGALDVLPALPLDAEREQPAAVLAATGTDDSPSTLLAPMLAPNPRNRGPSESIPVKVAATDGDAAAQKRVNVSACGVKEKQPLSIADNGLHERGRRDLNPQPPDRQSGTLTN